MIHCQALILLFPKLLGLMNDKINHCSCKWGNFS